MEVVAMEVDNILKMEELEDVVEEISKMEVLEGAVGAVLIETVGSAIDGGEEAGAYSGPYAPLPGRNNRACIVEVCAVVLDDVVDSVLGMAMVA